MELSGLNNYTDIYLQQGTTSEEVKDYSNSTDEELMEACKEFEQYFLEMMFEEMEKTIDRTESDSSATNTMTSYYREGLTQEYAAMATEGDGVGLAQMLFEQMKRNYE